MNVQEFELYWNTLLSFTGDVKYVDYEREELLSAIKYPASLYRFRSVSENSLSALQNNRMYFSSADYYDDPFDSYLRADIQKLAQIVNDAKRNPHSILPVLEQEYSSLTMFGIDIDKVNFSSFKGDVHKFREMLQQHLYSICFCENVENEVIWLKYAENHRGFVLEYPITEPWKKELWEQEPHSNILPVYYSDEPYDAYRYAVLSLVMSLLRCDNYNDFDLYVRALFQPTCWENTKISIIKKKCHKYDKEWRIVPAITLEERKSIQKKPQSVTIGLRTSEEDKQKIISAAQVAGITEFYKMVIDDHDNFVRKPLSI